VRDLIQRAPARRVYPVGRLDFTSVGLLILTNDGEFTRFMTRAGNVPKHYRVKVQGVPAAAGLDRLRRGINVDRERFAPCKIELSKPGANTWFDVGIRTTRSRASSAPRAFGSDRFSFRREATKEPAFAGGLFSGGFPVREVTR
jgi:pseudouridine synthase